MNFCLNDDLLLGVASAAAQIENGGLAVMKELGVQCCRLDIEWSRVEPEDGVFDEGAVAYYREEIRNIAGQGIPVLLALHSFDNPLWLEERGAFAVKDNISCFLRYVRKIVESVGDLVSEYITVNEPNAYAYNAYLKGTLPPGRKSFLLMSRVMTNIAAAHIEAYGLIRKTRLQMGFRDTKVGFACHLRAFAPQDPQDPLQRFWAGRLEELFQGNLVRAMCTGHAAFPIGRHPCIVPGVFCDFHGVSYFSRSTVSGPGDGIASGCAADDRGWEIYPQGIAEVCEKVYKMLNKPVYITGNGACDLEDRFRARFIAEHLVAAARCGLPVARYYYWRLCDGWERDEGRLDGSGLVYTDPGLNSAAVKKSGEFYRRVIAERGVSDSLYSEFCDVQYRKNEEGQP